MGGGLDIAILGETFLGISNVAVGVGSTLGGIGFTFDQYGSTNFYWETAAGGSGSVNIREGRPIKEEDTGTPNTNKPGGLEYLQDGGGQQGVVIDNTREAWNHYMNGNGSPAKIGSNTINSLLNNPDFQYRHNRIVFGLTTDPKGNFLVDMTSDVFHVGRTRVDYRIRCYGENCSVNYQLFVDDGFWDVDFIDENTLGMIPYIKDWTNTTPDRLGPNLERFGGTPYPYIPSTRIFYFPNPGYKF